MPKRPKTPCSQPGCPELVEAGQRFCPTHQTRDRRDRDRDHDRTRGTSSQRGYGTNWQRLRRMVLNAEPLCRHCKTAGYITQAEEVDHIDGDSGNLDRDNLQSLCKSCHSKKTVREQGGGWRPG